MQQKTIINECIRRIDTAEDYVQNPEEYIRTFDVTINGKLRHLVTYQANSKGYCLRKLHEFFAQYIRSKYRQSPRSFAYARGKCFQACVYQHLKSNVFLKTDIHSYFDSVSYDRMLKRIFQLNIPEEIHPQIELLTKACFYNGSLPIGYVSSPVLSDLFLVSLDRKYASDKNIVYTRYADDIIISSDNNDSAQHLSRIRLNLEKDLNELDLELNLKKTYIRKLVESGDAIHVLGVNIVKEKDKENRVTVSDRYIRKTSKALCLLLNKESNISDREEQFSKVYGQIDFISHCSSSSFLKLQKMVFIKSGYCEGFDIRQLRKACAIKE